jgi:hypothetical protein
MGIYDENDLKGLNLENCEEICGCLKPVPANNFSKILEDLN